MKKMMLFAAALLALAACSKEQTLDTNKGNAIDFRVTTGTRAAALVTNDVTSIPVTAFRADGSLYFSDTFTKEADPGLTFNSTIKYYWQGSEELSFYSYLPDDTPNVTLTEAAKTIADFVPAAAIADQKDLVAVKATGNNEDEVDGVALAFGHKLSAVKVTAVENKPGYQFVVKQVKIGNVNNKGTYDFVTNAWTLSSGEGIVRASFETPELVSPQTLSATPYSFMADGGAMLLPQQLVAWDKTSDKLSSQNYIAVLLQINVVDADEENVISKYFPSTADDDFAWAYIPVGTEWEMGKVYTYALNFSDGAGSDETGKSIFGKPIKFTVSVADWTTADMTGFNGTL